MGIYSTSSKICFLNSIITVFLKPWNTKWKAVTNTCIILQYLNFAVTLCSRGLARGRETWSETRDEEMLWCSKTKEYGICITSNLAGSDCWTEAEEVCKKDLGDGPLPFKLLCGPQIRGMPGSQRRHHWPRKRMKNMSTGQRQDSTEPGRFWIPILVSPLASLMLFASSRMTMKLGFFLVMWDW